MVKFRFVPGRYVTSFQKSDFYQTIKIHMLHQQFISQISMKRDDTNPFEEIETAKNDVY